MRTVVKPVKAIGIKENSVDTFYKFFINQTSGDP